MIQQCCNWVRVARRIAPLAVVCAMAVGAIEVGAALQTSPAAGASQRPRLNGAIARLERNEPALTPRDWMFIDMEHRPYVLDRLETTLADLAKRRRADGVLETAPIVRIPFEGDEEFRSAVKQVLDLGVFGVVFPRVDTAAQALAAVQAMRFPPQRGAKYPEPAGRRGWGPGRAASLWGLDVMDYAFRRADVWPLNPEGELLAMVMIESGEGVKNIDEIVKVPGIGAIFIGASDLGVSLGVGPPQAGVNAPETEAAVQRVLKACLASGVVCAYPALGGEPDVKKRLQEGFRMLLVAGAY